MKIKKNSVLPTGQFRNSLLIFIILASLMLISAVIELYKSKQELFQLMEKQAHSLLNSLITASQNSLLSNEYLEEVSTKRLLNNANLIRDMYEKGAVSNIILKRIAEQNDLLRINIFNKNGRKIYYNHERDHFNLPENNSPQELLQPIFFDAEDTLIIGFKAARFEAGYRFTVAVAARDRSAITVNIDAKEMLKFKSEIGFGALLRKVVEDNPQIVFVALQDSSNILAASGNVTELEPLYTSDFLQNALFKEVYSTRTTQFDSLQVYEAVHPFTYNNEPVGLFRIGFSLQAIDDINRRIYIRLIFITLILIIVGSVLFTYMFTRQRLRILQKEYEIVETYSSKIVDNVSDTIIVFDQAVRIKIFNSAAEQLFSVTKTDALGQHLDEILSEEYCTAILQDTSKLKQLNCTIGNREKHLLVSRSRFADSDENENLILVIKDLTDQKYLEEQLERQQRLSAMGELASGVAHEIRNPLNTIGTIIQQLDKDFEPAESGKEYHDLAGLVYGEVKRINETVQDFLRFARPEPVQPNKFNLQDLFSQLQKQYGAELKKRRINLDINLKWQGEVYWDENQIKQVFINLIQNANEAVNENGQISIDVRLLNDNELEILLIDDGPGMPENIRDNIFNLYFTTKAKGTGIGLSIVQRIIFEHGGIIRVKSRPGEGTEFILRMPVLVNK